MKKTTILLAIMLSLVVSSYSQLAVLKGTISDTAAKQNLEHALVTVLRAKDSTLYKFGRADAQGHFEIKNLLPGKYKVVVTAPNYADYVDDINVADKPIALGTIGLITKAHLLEDVIVRQQIAAIRLKGDTIEYKADSFKVRAGASVEEMLKKVPGFQVDKDGKITVHGDKIEKVLVDGEEFFGDDPTVATKNLDAAALDKFQVFDKKSDQATFTGIDDGIKTKTLNLKLKEDRKRGVFGKLELGGGPQDKWNNSLMANAFKGKRKLSFYGIMSSTGKTGLGWDEANKYGDNTPQAFVADDGNTYYSAGNYDSFGDVYGSGIPKSWSAGINYGNKFDQDKQNVNGSYKYGKILTEGSGTTVSQSALADTLFYNSQSSKTYSDRYRSTLSGYYEWMFDSTFSAKFTVRGYRGNTKTRSLFESEALNANSNPVNRSNRLSSSNADEESLNMSLILRKKFKKPGRTISLNIDQRYVSTNTDGFLYALNRYYDKTSLPFRSDTTDQEKINGSLNKAVIGRLAYTEALSKTVTMELSYGLGKTLTESKLLSYDRDNTGKYEKLNTQFSNSYAYDILTNTGGLMMRYNSKKYQISLGGDVARTDVQQRNLIKDSTLKYAYNNLFPRANATYKFNANKRINLSYNGNTRQPTIQQLQPVADNTNPLNVQVGNPNLKQEFNHSFNLNYNDYKVLKERGINFSIYYSMVANAIRNNTSIDSVGRTIYQYVNMDGNYNYRARAGYSQKVPALWGMNVNTSLSYYKNVTTSFVNGKSNKTLSSTEGFNLGISKYKENKYDFYMSGYANYNRSNSSIRPDVNNNYWSYGSYLDMSLHLGDYEFYNSVSASFRQATTVFKDNNNMINWEATFSKKIFKDKKSEIKLSAFDILNQNKGINRNTTTTTVTQSTYQTIGQYFLVSFVWNFLKNGAGTPTAGAPTPVK